LALYYFDQALKAYNNNNNTTRGNSRPLSSGPEIREGNINIASTFNQLGLALKVRLYDDHDQS